jgi:hypothetical protein
MQLLTLMFNKVNTMSIFFDRGPKPYGGPNPPGKNGNGKPQPRMVSQSPPVPTSFSSFPFL